MQVAVWDTYVLRHDGRIMHFDIIVPHTTVNQETIFEFGRQYLQQKGQAQAELQAKQCAFCHVETVHPLWQEGIEKNGYFIVELENCQ